MPIANVPEGSPPSDALLNRFVDFFFIQLALVDRPIQVRIQMAHQVSYHLLGIS